MVGRALFILCGVTFLQFAVGVKPSHAFKLKVPNPIKIVKSAVKEVRDAPKNAVKAAKNAGDAAIHPGRTIERTGKNIGQTFKDASHGKFRPATVMSVAIPGSGFGVAGAASGSGPARGVAMSGSGAARPLIPSTPKPFGRR